MQKLFNKIVVPFDFSIKSEKALNKAVEMAREYNCNIHLLHVVSIPPFAAVATAESRWITPYSMIANKKQLGLQLEKLCKFTQDVTKGIIKVEYSIVHGTWDEAIIDFVNQNKSDVVLIGQPGRINGRRKMQLNADRIAEKTNIPVITIPLNRTLTGLSTIVIPITDFLPVRKLMYGLYMATGHPTTLRLLGVKNKVSKEKVEKYLKRSYQLIHDNSGVPVEIETVIGENVAEAVNEFAMLHSADLVILNPGSQTKMPGFFSSLFGNVIQRYSGPPVLTVNVV